MPSSTILLPDLIYHKILSYLVLPVHDILSIYRIINCLDPRTFTQLIPVQLGTIIRDPTHRGRVQPLPEPKVYQTNWLHDPSITYGHLDIDQETIYHFLEADRWKLLRIQSDGLFVLLTKTPLISCNWDHTEILLRFYSSPLKPSPATPFRSIRHYYYQLQNSIFRLMFHLGWLGSITYHYWFR